MKIISHEDILNLNVTNTECYEWVKEALSLKADSYLPSKCSIKPEGDTFYTSMPCLIPQLDVYGLKMVSRLSNQNPALNSTIMLFKASTGEPLCVMDCNWITAKRTGAVASLTILNAAKKDFATIGCIGLGNTCDATLDILLEKINKNITILLKKYKNQHVRVIERYKKFENVQFKVVDTNEELISSSDVIISCITSTKYNLGEDDWFKEGVTVVPVHTMGFQNCDLFFDRFIIDDYEHVKNFKYFNQYKNVTELEEILKRESLRKNDFERIIAYNVGIAIHDVYFAYRLFQKIEKEEQFKLNNITEKFWM